MKRSELRIIPSLIGCFKQSFKQFWFVGGQCGNNRRISILTLDNKMVLYNMCITNRDVAQPGSAPEWGSGGPGFKSPRPDQKRQ